MENPRTKRQRRPTHGARTRPAPLTNGQIISPSKIKICWLIDQMSLGGREQLLLGLLPRLKDRSIETIGIVLTTEPKDPTPTACQAAMHTDVFNSTTAVSWLHNQADVTIVWGYGNATLLEQPGLKRHPIVGVLHSECHGSEAIAAQLKHLVTHRVGVSQGSTAIWRDPNATTILNGADEQRLIPSQSAETTKAMLGIKHNERIVTYLGRLSDEKRPLAAALAAQELGPPWRSLTHGASGRPTIFMERIRQHDPNAIWIPPHAHIGDTLAISDVVMVASYNESCPLVWAECWLSKTPLAATKVGALADLERTWGQLAAHIPSNANQRQLAAAALSAANRQHATVVDHAHTLALNHFTADGCARRWARYLRAIAP